MKSNLSLYRLDSYDYIFVVLASSLQEAKDIITGAYLKQDAGITGDDLITVSNVKPDVYALDKKGLVFAERIGYD